MGDVSVIPLVDEGLGNSAYLVDLADGRALAVDASRDLRRLRAAADKRGLALAYAADTHLHADFLTGAVALAAHDGATVLASVKGNRKYPHTALADGDEVDLGGLTLRTLATPGHTHEHIAFELLDGAETLGVFTGGSLLVGSAARTDLVAPERTEELARAQYRSLQRLAKLADDVAVWPTHIELRPVFALWLGWLVAADKAPVIVRNPDQDPAEIVWQARKVGYDLLVGELDHGIASWIAAGQPTSSIRLITADRIGAARVLDIRQDNEYTAGHLPAADHIELGALASRARDLPPGPTVLMCGHGQRAMSAASMLASAGRNDLVVLAGGPQGWAESTGEPLELAS